MQRSPCPLANSLELFGDKWTLLVIRDLFAGKSHFKEFAASPEKIATNTLTIRLKRLLEHSLIRQIPSNEVPGKMAYELTEKGHSLYPVLQAICDWGIENIEGTRAIIAVGEDL